MRILLVLLHKFATSFAFYNYDTHSWKPFSRLSPSIECQELPSRSSPSRVQSSPHPRTCKDHQIIMADSLQTHQTHQLLPFHNTINEYDDDVSFTSTSTSDSLRKPLNSFDDDDGFARRSAKDNIWWRIMPVRARRKLQAQVRGEKEDKDDEGDAELIKLYSTKRVKRKSNQRRTWFTYCIFGSISGLTILYVYIISFPFLPPYSLPVFLPFLLLTNYPSLLPPLPKTSPNSATEHSSSSQTSSSSSPPFTGPPTSTTFSKTGASLALPQKASPGTLPTSPVISFP